jgi:hypothetical protein
MWRFRAGSYPPPFVLMKIPATRDNPDIARVEPPLADQSVPRQAVGRWRAHDGYEALFTFLIE